MKRLLLIFILHFSCFIIHSQAAPRVIQNMNFGWKFHNGDIPGAEAESFNDSSWRNIDIPHDFLIEQAWIAPDASERPDNSDPGANIRSRLSPRGFKEMGIGWYRKTFTPDAALKGKRVLLDFEGIMLVGDVYLNGQRIGGTDYGYVGFEIDVTNLLRYGEPNVLAVKADTGKESNSRWYTGGGLFRDVHLIATHPRLYFARHPLRIETKNISTSSATISLQTEIACQYDSKTKFVTVEVSINDADGKTVATHRQELPFRPQQKLREYQLSDISLLQPQLWDCDNPYLYTAQVKLFLPDGTLTDSICEHFGVRSVEFSPEYGLRLNGKKVLLKGIANHHTLGALGAAAYPRAIEKRIQLLKSFGINHIRTSHNPYSRSLIELCDRYGILVVDELYDKWTRQHTGGRTPWEHHWQYDVPEWVKRDRNSPSVVLWSLGNELQQDPNQAFNDWGVTAYRLQKTLLKRYDDTRLVTVAMHPRYRNWETDSLPCDLAMETDVQAYNYRYMYFPTDGRRFPHMIFYQSEASTAAMGPNYYEMDLDRVIGLAYWGAIDYLGESQGWPEKGWAQGFFDITLQPKPAAYLIKSMFCDEPVVHIGIQEASRTTEWNGIKTGLNRLSDHWNRTEGESLSVMVYTNADEVELRVNGKVVGTQKNDRSNPKLRNQLRFTNIIYHSGNIEAIARNGGKIVALHKIETTGEAVALKLEPDNSAWTADGIDLQHVRITAVDSKGRRVVSANHLVKLNITGDARIAAVGNGNMSSDDINVGNEVHLNEGSALAILRAGQGSSRITLTATADQLRTATIKLETK